MDINEEVEMLWFAEYLSKKYKLRIQGEKKWKKKCL